MTIKTLMRFLTLLLIYKNAHCSGNFNDRESWNIHLPFFPEFENMTKSQLPSYLDFCNALGSGLYLQDSANFLKDTPITKPPIKRAHKKKASNFPINPNRQNRNVESLNSHTDLSDSTEPTAHSNNTSKKQADLSPESDIFNYLFKDGEKVKNPKEWERNQYKFKTNEFAMKNGRLYPIIRKTTD